MLRKETLRSNLLPKLGLVRRISFASFPSYLLKNVSIGFIFIYAQYLHLEGAKKDTIMVTRKVNVKLQHHKGLVRAYPMENKMPLVHHAIKQQGCCYTIEEGAIMVTFIVPSVTSA
jgi:hypothetical protein